MVLRLFQNRQQPQLIQQALLQSEDIADDIFEEAQISDAAQADPIVFKDPEFKSPAVDSLNLTLAILTVLQVILIIVTWLGIVPLFSGKPPESYRRMMEQAPDSLQEIFQRD